MIVWGFGLRLDGLILQMSGEGSSQSRGRSRRKRHVSDDDERTARTAAAMQQAREQHIQEVTAAASEAFLTFDNPIFRSRCQIVRGEEDCSHRTV